MSANGSNASIQKPGRTNEQPRKRPQGIDSWCWRLFDLVDSCSPTACDNSGRSHRVFDEILAIVLCGGRLCRSDLSPALTVVTAHSARL